VAGRFVTGFTYAGKMTRNIEKNCQIRTYNRKECGGCQRKIVCISELKITLLLLSLKRSFLDKYSIPKNRVSPDRGSEFRCHLATSLSIPNNDPRVERFLKTIVWTSPKQIEKIEGMPIPRIVLN
jgi:hypothetical protein